MTYFNANHSVTEEATLAVFDTRIGDNNLGNHIIMQGVETALRDTFGQVFMASLPYLDKLSRQSCELLANSNYRFFGGGNCLTGRMEKYAQWSFTPEDVVRVAPRDGNLGVILLGVGWWQYEDSITRYSRRLIHRVLHPEHIHAVRDEYTADMLRTIGINHVLNTGCPSTWSLTPEHCQRIAATRADSVLMTLTCYNRKPERDRSLYECLKQHYNQIYFWVQSPEDAHYVRDMGWTDLRMVSPTLEQLDTLLRTQRVDYIGTRLHAGIRALQHGQRSLIIGIDNRAREMHRDIDLPVLDQAELNQLHAWIAYPTATAVHIPQRAIAMWKAQFQAQDDATCDTEADDEQTQALTLRWAA